MSTPASAEVALGIDVGTTSVKVLLLDAAGEVVASASHQHGISEAAGLVEVDAENWWNSFRAALAELEVERHRIAAIGFSGNMSSVVVVDEELTPLLPAVLLADTRGSTQLRGLGDDLTARIVAGTGNLPEAVFSLSTLLWLRDERPDLLGRAHAVLTAKDYLRARLTGVLAAEATDSANTLLIRDGAWDDALIAALGLPRAVFPPLLASDGDGGVVTPPAAAQTGLPAGTPVALGAGDVQAALVGSGGLKSDSLAVSLGTSVTVMVPLPGGILPPELTGKLTVHPDADGGTIALGSLLTGGLALNWLRDTLGLSGLAEVTSLPLDADLHFLPYLAGSGSPDFVGELRGTVYGLTPATRPAELYAALLEAIAFDIADLVDAVDGSYRSVLVSGGGSRIEAWPQVLADVIGTPVTCYHAPDLSAIGAAILAWRRIGVPVRPGGGHAVVPPRPELRPRWQQRRSAHQRARRAALAYYADRSQP